MSDPYEGYTLRRHIDKMRGMLTALESIISVILMIALGFVLSKRDWFDAAAGALISRIVVSQALPCYMISNLLGGYDRAKLISRTSRTPPCSGRSGYTA